MAVSNIWVFRIENNLFLPFYNTHVMFFVMITLFIRPLLLGELVWTFYSTSVPGPTITGTIENLEANTMYQVHFEIMMTDIDHDNEYATINMNGANLGECGELGFSLTKCTYHDCSSFLISRNIQSNSSGEISIVVSYSNRVDNGHGASCTYNGETVSGLVRFTLTKSGNILYDFGYIYQF